MSEKQPQSVPESNESDEITLEKNRSTPKWKELFRDNLSHVRKTYPENTPEGEKVTEDWLHTEATQMADALYKMKKKQEAIERKTKQNYYPTSLDSNSRAELEEQLLSDNPVTAEAARRALDLFKDTENK